MQTACAPLRGRGGFGGEAAVHETPLDVEPGGGALERFAVVRFGVEDDGLDHGDALLLGFRIAGGSGKN